MIDSQYLFVQLVKETRKLPWTPGKKKGLRDSVPWQKVAVKL